MNLQDVLCRAKGHKLQTNAGETGNLFLQSEKDIEKLRPLLIQIGRKPPLGKNINRLTKSSQAAIIKINFLPQTR
jgi:hypothetical protein